MYKYMFYNSFNPIDIRVNVDVDGVDVKVYPKQKNIHL